MTPPGNQPRAVRLEALVNLFLCSVPSRAILLATAKHEIPPAVTRPRPLPGPRISFRAALCAALLMPALAWAQDSAPAAAPPADPPALLQNPVVGP